MHTSTPATAPISTAAGAATKAQGAVIATRPASAPLASIEGSGLPERAYVDSIAATQPAALASMVLAAITVILRSAASSVAPAVKPNQPNIRISVPASAIGMLCPGMAFAVPSELYLPRRAPRSQQETRAMTPPVMWTTDDPAKSTWPCPSPKLTPSWESHPPPQTQLA